MSGVRSEPAEVWLVNDRPARFVWRERLYTVLSVLEEPRDDVREQEWRCWRVRASAGRNMPGNFYRLCRNAASGRWHLSRSGR